MGAIVYAFVEVNFTIHFRILTQGLGLSMLFKTNNHNNNKKHDAKYQPNRDSQAISVHAWLVKQEFGWKRVQRARKNIKTHSKHNISFYGDLIIETLKIMVSFSWPRSISMDAGVYAVFYFFSVIYGHIVFRFFPSSQSF